MSNKQTSNMKSRKEGENNKIPLIRISFISGILLLSDLVMVFFSFYLATAIRGWLIPWLGGQVFWPAYLPIVYLCMGFTAILFLLNGLYPGYGLTAVKELAKIIKTITLVYTFLGVSVYLLKSYTYFPRSIFFTAWLISLITIPLMRFVIRNRVSLTGWYGIPVIYINDETFQSEVFESIMRCRRMGWNVIGIFHHRKVNHEYSFSDIPTLFTWEEMTKFKEKNRINTAIYSSSLQETQVQENGDTWRLINSLFKKVIMVIPNYHLASVWVEPRDLEGRLGLELTFHLLDPVAKILKRVLDLIGGLILILILSPILLFISIAIYVDSPGLIFYRQKRLGRSFETFWALKFRTMIKDADKRLREILESNPEVRREYEIYHKLSDDPRITWIGRLLRKYSLDELPQLWNVIKGEMSLVGPRAYMPEELNDMGKYADLILKVRPGMTGWWQVMGRQNTTFQTRLRMDEYYLSNWSLWMDLYIFYKTIWVVLSGTGT